MRILAAADIHGIRRVYDWLIGTAQERSADLLILAGDLFEGDWEDGQRRQADAIAEKLALSGLRVLYLMGNDDNVPLGYEDERIQCVDSRRIEMNGFSFVGYQYTPPFVGQTFVKTEEEMAADLDRLAPLLDERTVFITHAPALGTLDGLAGGERVGSPSIAAVLQERPWLAHIHGHVHRCYGREGRHFNVASAGVCRAALIELPALDAELLDGRS